MPEPDKAPPDKTPSEPTMRPADAPEGAGLPPLYNRVRPVEPARHGDWGVADSRSYGFAARTRAIPITGAEFPTAARDYPIVFVTQPSPMAAVLVGLRNDENLFVDGKGAWRQGAYLPAYLRRYPFIVAQSQDGGRLILCIDESSELVAKQAPLRLFEGGRRSAFLERMLQLGADIHRDQIRTSQIVQLLDNLQLLTEKRIEVGLPGGEKVAFQGFRVVDERKLNELPDDKFLELRRSGGLGLVYLHMVSFANLRVLGDIAAERKPAPAR